MTGCSVGMETMFFSPAEGLAMFWMEDLETIAYWATIPKTGSQAVPAMMYCAALPAMTSWRAEPVVMY